MGTVIMAALIPAIIFLCNGQPGEEPYIDVRQEVVNAKKVVLEGRSKEEVLKEDYRYVNIKQY